MVKQWLNNGGKQEVILVLSCMSKSAGATFGVGELFHLDDVGLLVAGNDHLGDTLAVAYDDVLLREVYQYHAYLAAVVGVDGARRVEDGDALLQRQAAAGTHLRLVSCGQLHEEAGLHQAALEEKSELQSQSEDRDEEENIEIKIPPQFNKTFNITLIR